jgi:hypothetical protein
VALGFRIGVAPQVVAELVPGGGEVRDRLRSLGDRAATQEEGGAAPVLLKGGGDLRRPARGPVVKGECDLVPPALSSVHHPGPAEQSQRQPADGPRGPLALLWAKGPEARRRLSV